MEEQNTFEGMEFPDIGDPEPIVEVSDEQKRLAALEEERKEWQARFDRQQEKIEQLLSRPAEPEHVKDPEFLSVDLPDPVSNPDEFKAALKKRDEDFKKYVSELNASQLRQTMSAQEEKQKLNQMWTDFRTKNPDLDDEILIETIVRKESQALIAEGKDPKRLMLSDPDRFMERVANSTRSYLSKYKTEPNRTAGIPGGDSGGNRPKQDAAPDFINQIKDFQRKDGYF